MQMLVYGTLRKGFGNEHFLRNAHFLGSARIAGFKMYDLGFFPGAVRAKDGMIYGEVYSLSSREEIKAVDRLEGHPTFYKREEISTPLGKSWIYLLAHPKQYEHYRIVPNGVWGGKLL